MTHVAPLPCQWNSTKHRVTVSVPQKNLCVDDTGPGPTLTLLALAGFWNRFPTSLIYLNSVAPHLVVFYFSDRGDYRVLLQLSYHPIGARNKSSWFMVRACQLWAFTICLCPILKLVKYHTSLVSLLFITSQLDAAYSNPGSLYK